MTRILRRIGVPVVVVVVLLGAPRPTHAALIVTMQEVAGDVLVSGSGTANLAALSFLFNAFGIAAISPSEGLIILGDNFAGPLLNVYGGLSGPLSFGSGGLTFATSATGDLFGLRGEAGVLAVPDGYVSGTSLNATSMFASATFASLGVTPGTYVWTWGSGNTSDSLTLRIGGAAVPEPVSVSLLAVCAAGLTVRRWRRSA